MKITDDREFPAALAALSGITFPWEFDEEAGEAGVATMDYEPYQKFDSAEKTTGWIRAWTGNEDLDGDALGSPVSIARCSTLVPRS